MSGREMKRGGGHFVPAHHVRDHIATLNLPPGRIAWLAGVSKRTVTDLIAGRETIRSTTAAKLLAVNVTAPQQGATP